MLDIPLWESPDDNGRYHAACHRVAERHGMLTLVRLADGVTVRQQEVPLAYGAVFGPDVSDVQDWQDMATAWSEELDKAG